MLHVEQQDKANCTYSMQNDNNIYPKGYPYLICFSNNLVYWMQDVYARKIRVNKAYLYMYNSCHVTSLPYKLLTTCFCLTHWRPELFAKNASFGHFGGFQAAWMLAKLALIWWKRHSATQQFFRLLATSIAFYNIFLAWACAEIKIWFLIF